MSTSLRVTDLPFEFGKIGYWSELKLEIVEKYGSAYTRAFAHSPNLKKYYIDGFSGAGRHVAKRTGQEVEGSPARALKISPPFDGFYFIDLNPRKTGYLQLICEGRSDVKIHTGDSSAHLIRTILPTIQYEKYTRALCLLDPYDTAHGLGSHAARRKVSRGRYVPEFPGNGHGGDAIWQQPERVPKDGVERMNHFWGDESWRTAAYSDTGQAEAFRIRAGDSEATERCDRRRLHETAAGCGRVPLCRGPASDEKQQSGSCLLSILRVPSSVAEKIITAILTNTDER